MKTIQTFFGGSRGAAFQKSPPGLRGAEPIQHELKYVFSAGRAHLVQKWLDGCCLPDPEFPAGVICSIYYDTQDWAFLREKVDSDFYKTKVRARWYKDIETDEPYPGSFLEAKFKVGGRREKVRVDTKRHGSWFSSVSLDNPELLHLLRLLWREGVLPHAPLYPAFRIDYRRYRYIEPVTGSRLSLDFDIHAPFVNGHMLPKVDPFYLGEAVFEMKGPLPELPGNLYGITALGGWKDSFSKYGKCYEKIMKITF